MSDPAIRAALEAARALDKALSCLWREGPVEAGRENHLGPVDEAWKALREALAALEETARDA
jgi:hypothetical protein